MREFPRKADRETEPGGQGDGGGEGHSSKEPRFCSVRLGLPSTSYERERRLQGGGAGGALRAAPDVGWVWANLHPGSAHFWVTGEAAGRPWCTAETTSSPPLRPPQGTHSMAWAQHLLAPYGGSAGGSLWAVDFPVGYFTPGTNEGP